MRLPKVGYKKKSASAGRSNRVPRATYYQGSYQVEPKASPFKKRLPTKPGVARRLTKIIDWFVVIAVVFCLLYSLLVKPEPRVLSNSWAYHSATVYDNFAAKNVSGLLDRTKLTFNETSVVMAMQKQFPEISSAWVQMPIFGQKPTIHLTVSAPAFVYNVSSASYILDNDGVVVDTQAKLTAIKNLPTLIDQSPIKIVPGVKAVSSSSVSFINQVLAQAKKAKIPVTNIVLPPVAQEMQLHTTDKPYYVKFYFGNDVNQQIGQWLAARHEFDTKGIAPAEYLDVRVPGKVFYK